MPDINLRSRRKNSFYTKLVIVSLIILILILAKATWSVFNKDRGTKENLTETEEDLSALQARGNSLEEEIRSLNTEKGVDEEIRTKFRVVKGDEGMIMLIDSPEGSTTTSSFEEKGLWSRIMDLF